jgi:riboflavin kinase/FMN adenylyltransferase
MLPCTILKSGADWKELLQGLSPIVNIAFGNFDGVHLGHQAFIKEMVNHSGSCGIVTFWPHTRCVVASENWEGYLFSLDERIEKLRAIGISSIIVIEFDSEVARMGSQELLEKISFIPGLKRIFLGYDSWIGNQAALKEEQREKILEAQCDKVGIELHRGSRLQLIDKGGLLTPSSSEIRKLLKMGDMKGVEKLLGTEYSVIGTVKAGRGVGRTLGYPTANLFSKTLSWESRAKLLYGVYAITAVTQGGKEIMHGVANFGLAPTFQGERPQEPILEVHLYSTEEGGRDLDLYGVEIKVNFKYYLRAEKKFNNPLELEKQISLDIAQAQKLLAL